jgi:hypothetical protein
MVWIRHDDFKSRGLWHNILWWVVNRVTRANCFHVRGDSGGNRTYITNRGQDAVRIWLGRVVKCLDKTQVKISLYPNLRFLKVILEITTKTLPLDSRTACSSRQDSFIFLYFLHKDWLTEFNLSYSLFSFQKLVVEWRGLIAGVCSNVEQLNVLMFPVLSA